MDGDTGNNAIINLRNVTNDENAKSKKKYKNNKSGISGVGWRERRKKWEASISLGKGKNKFLGYFTDKRDAANAVEKAKAEFGYFHSHGLR